METRQTAHTFLGALQRSRLLGELQIARVLEAFPLHMQPSPEAIAKSLVDQRLLTPYQAERLLEGNHRGLRIDRYKVLAPLGSGGMSALFLAEDVETGVRRALKVLPHVLGEDPGMLARFKLEVRAGMMLDHPNIARTLEMGQAGSAYYAAIEFAEAINIHEIVCLQGVRPWPQACDLIRQAAAGLQRVHELGLVHRDIKPANLVVCADGLLKIVDFGLVLFDTETEHDEFSLVMLFGHDRIGTEEFIAPEQSVNSFKVDSRADLYSLGCTLYFALTGRLPRPARSPGCAAGGTDERLPQWREKLQGLPAPPPPEVISILERMLAPLPEDRQASAADICEALAPFAARSSVTFDFDELLKLRERARSRQDASLSPQMTSPRITSHSSRPAGSAPTRSPLAALDTSRTAERENTAVGRNASCRAKPDDSTAAPPPVMPSREATAVGKAAAFQAGIPFARLTPSGGGRSFVLRRPELTIGRSAASDLVLPSPAVSSEHAALLFQAGRWQIIDAGSRNGTEVNGVKVTRHVLRPGDTISIAKQYQFEFQSDAGNGVFHGWGKLLGGSMAVVALIAFLVWIWVVIHP